ncbi:MAG: outer membrane lipoprotein LolB [Thiobacillus sp.]|nr:outer membrane lipoprotein LolB [Thiobacillus sp.]
MARLATALAFMLALAGCASTPPVAPVDTRAALPDRWSLQGRIGVKSTEQSLSGNMLWKHRGGTDELLLASPLGQGVARIVRDPSGVALEVPNQPVRRAADAESLTRAVLGYGLPVAGLTWWVQARPAPGSTFEATRDSRNRFEQILQDGWTINYLRYADDAPDRPQKLALMREGLEIRLIVDSWKGE